jgi:predicted nucleic acid-binding protein
VITEAAWLLRNHSQALARLLAALDSGPFELIPLTSSDLPGISALLSKYSTLGLQLADASLAHLAAREKIDCIFTLDRRDFGVLRSGSRKKLRLIP